MLHGNRHGFAITVVVALLLLAVGLFNGSPVCEAVRYWWIWAPNPPPPPTQGSMALIPIDVSGATVTGSIHYSNGHLGDSGRQDLPLRLLCVDVGGVAACVEDGYWCEVLPDERIAARERDGRRTLVAYLQVNLAPGDRIPLCHQKFVFESDEAVELDLPFAIELKDDGVEGHPLTYSASLGEMQAEASQQWCEAESAWDPLLKLPDQVIVTHVMAHGRSGVCYGNVDVAVDGKPLDMSGFTDDRGTWLVTGMEGSLLCEFLANGPVMP